MVRAIMAHENVNHRYNGSPYSVHLIMVVHYARKYLYLVPESVHQDVVDACWLHDTIEDARLTYNDVKKFTNNTVADIVYAVTNEKGRNRAERANANYYAGIRDTPWAVFVKLCDRLANVSYSLTSKSTMFEVYKKEHVSFCNHILLNRKSVYEPMVKELEELVNYNP